jgi:hypothetical protein
MTAFIEGTFFRSVFSSTGSALRPVCLGIVSSLFLIACTSFSKPNPSDLGTAHQLFEIRQGTDRYLNIERARNDGYFKASGYIPHQGYQFINPRYLSFFDLRRPPILLYDEHNGQWQLLGVMFTVPRTDNPARVLPFKHAEFLAHEAMCHYQDGTVIPAKEPEDCPKRQPLTQAEFGVWHPDLWLVSVWAWTPNPNGLFSLFNPLLEPPGRP